MGFLLTLISDGVKNENNLCGPCDDSSFYEGFLGSSIAKKNCSCWQAVIHKYVLANTSYVLDMCLSSQVSSQAFVDMLYCKKAFQYRCFKDVLVFAGVNTYESHFNMGVVFSKIFTIDCHCFNSDSILIAGFMGPTWGPSGADRTQVGPMLAPWTLLFIGYSFKYFPLLYPLHNEVVGGYIGFTPSVRPASVPRPSRIPCPLCSAYSSGWIHFIFVHLIKQLQKMCRM